jgi:hypothetical protein
MVIRGLSVVTVAWREDERFDRWLDDVCDVAESVLVIDNSPGEHSARALRGGPSRSARVVAPAGLDPTNLAALRNRGIELVDTEFTMVLDSDEGIDAAALPYIEAALRESDVQCWFAPWDTYDGSGELRIADYKLVMWRTSHRLTYTEAVHQSVTAQARSAGLRAGYIGHPIAHVPRPELRARKRGQYVTTLESVWGREPCTRIQWFLANSYLQTGRHLDALAVCRLTDVPHESLHPVESINLACLRSILTEDPAEATRAFECARALMERCSEDLEMVAFARKPHARTLLADDAPSLSVEQITASCHCMDP